MFVSVALMACGAVPTKETATTDYSSVGSEPCGGEEPEYAQGEPEREPMTTEAPAVTTPPKPIARRIAPAKPALGSSHAVLCRHAVTHLYELFREADLEESITGPSGESGLPDIDAAVAMCLNEPRAVAECVVRANQMMDLMKCSADE